MFYDFTISVPANTTEDDPEELIMKLTQGVITKVEVEFPFGCCYLARCRIRQNGATFLPTNPSGYLTGNGFSIVIPEEKELTSEPYSLTAVCWNSDDTLPHTIYIRVSVLRGDASIWMLRVLRGIEKFLRMVGIKV